MRVFVPGLARLLACVGGTLMAVSLSAQPAAPDERARTTPDRGDAEQLLLTTVADRIVERTNEFRATHDTRAVEVAAALQDASGYFAEYMASTDTYSHTADGNRPAERAEAHGYDFCIVTENIAYSYREAGFPDEDALAEEFVQGWIDSPQHRRNMLDADVTEIGVGVARSERSGRYYAVQKFGRPQAEALEFSIANDWSRAVDYQLDGRTFALEPGQVRQHRVCRPPEVAVSFPRRQRHADQTIHPQAGDRFVISGRNGEAEPEVVRR